MKNLNLLIIFTIVALSSSCDTEHKDPKFLKITPSNFEWCNEYIPLEIEANKSNIDIIQYRLIGDEHRSEWLDVSSGLSGYSIPRSVLETNFNIESEFEVSFRFVHKTGFGGGNVSEIHDDRKSINISRSSQCKTENVEDRTPSGAYDGNLPLVRICSENLPGPSLDTYIMTNRTTSNNCTIDAYNVSRPNYFTYTNHTLYSTGHTMKICSNSGIPTGWSFIEVESGIPFGQECKDVYTGSVENTILVIQKD